MNKLVRWLDDHERAVLYALLVIGFVRVFIIAAVVVLVAQWVMERLK